MQKKHNPFPFFFRNIQKYKESDLNLQNCLCITGFPYDEGTKINNGRLGAEVGPKAFREALNQSEFLEIQSNLQVKDTLDIEQSLKLQDAHLKQTQKLLNLLENKATIFSIGGYPNALALLQAYKTEKIGVINIDAHMDCRPLIDGKAHSGSPFRLLLNDQLFQQTNSKFINFANQGAQCSQDHYEFIIQNNQKVVWLNKDIRRYQIQDEIQYKTQAGQYFYLMMNYFKNEDCKHIFVSFDVDAINSAYCPGVSAPSVIGGLTEEEAFEIMDISDQLNQLILVNLILVLKKKQLPSFYLKCFINFTQLEALQNEYQFIIIFNQIINFIFIKDSMDILEFQSKLQKNQIKKFQIQIKEILINENLLLGNNNLIYNQIFIKILKSQVLQDKNDKYLDLALKIAQNKSLKNKQQEIIKSIIKEYPEDLIHKKLLEIQDLKIQNNLFYLLNKQQKLLFQNQIKDYLSSKFLQDQSNQKFYKWMNDIVDIEFYKQYIHRQSINLVNRNPLNLNILQQIVESIELDYTNFITDYIELLKDLILDEKLQDQSINILSLILKKSITPTQKDIDQIKNIITKTFNEKQKIKLFQLMTAFNSEETTEFIINQLMGIQLDESLNQIKDVLKVLPLNQQIIQQIKKNLTSQNGKFLAILLNILLNNKNYELNDFIDQTIVQNYLKNPAKIVQNYQCFLPAICLIQNQNQLIQLLKPDLFINKITFQTKAQRQELQQILQAYSKINLANLNEQQILLLIGVLFQTIKNKLITTSDLFRFFQNNTDLAINLIFLNQFYPEFDDSKYQFLVNLVIKNIKDVSDQFLFQLFYSIYGIKVTKKQQQKFLKNISNIKQRIFDNIDQNQNNYLCVALNPYSNQRFSKLFADLKCQFIFDKIKDILVYENYLVESDQIQKIDDIYNSNSFFVDLLQNLQQYLIDNQFIDKKLPYIELKIKNEVQSVQKKKQTKNQPQEVQKKEKIEYFDEQSIKIYQKQQKLNLGLKYLELITPILKNITSNPAIQQNFFQNYYNEIIRLSEIKETHKFIFEILISIFHSSNETSCHAIQLAELIMKVHNDETQNDDNIENIILILKKIQKLKQSDFIYFYKQICCHFLKNKNFESKIKKEAVHSIFNIFSQGLFDLEDLHQCYEIFIDNINNLGKHPYSEQLFMFLVKNIEKQKIKLIFKDLLNLNQNAQNLMLKSLLLDEVQNLPANFEMFITLQIIFEQNNEYGLRVFQKVDFLQNPLNEDSVNEFDLYRFLTNNSKESTDSFCQIIKQEIKSQKMINILIEKTLQSIRKLKQYDLPEETLLFMPTFFVLFDLDPILYENIFLTIIEICCDQELPNLFEKSLQLCVNLIKQKGSQFYNQILQILDPFLEKKISIQQQIFVLVCMGVLAPFIKNKEKVNNLGSKILNLLKIPDENVQKSIAKCIPDLFIFFDNPQKLVQDTLKNIFQEKNYEIQRGQAYLISGLIKGLGVATIETEKIFDLFQNSDKKDNVHKLGLLFILFALQENLQKLFEPYFLHFFQFLMPFFAENNDQIRSLSIQVCKLGMSQLSSYGVSLLLPILLQQLDEKPQWRSKIANLWALGNMAYCSPKTLSSCLPQIVPVLSNSISDTHPKIQSAALDALSLIGQTIRNPEITLIVDVIIKSLSNPFDENKKGLNILLKTEFAHFIDVPALSLIIPVIEYGLTSKDQQSKEMAGKIVATISYLINDPKDFMPYLDTLIKSLKETISDHLTEVRQIAAKAFGSLGKKLSVQYSEPIKKTLFNVLDSDTSTSVERAGAAQGLCEVIYNIGIEQFELYLPVILKNTQNANKQIREGYIGMFIFFPQIMEKSFEKYISISLEYILVSISDQTESLRNLSLRVIRIFIQKYGNKHVDLLLNPVLEGAFSNDYLRRMSCGMLMDDILKNVKMENEEFYNKTIIYLYILRHDFIDTIKIQATNTWKVNYFQKANIENTPKTLKKLLNILIFSLCDLLNLNSPDIEIIINGCIKEFIEKYQEQCLFGVIQNIEKIIRENPELKWAAFKLLEQIILNSERILILKIVDKLILIIREFMADSNDILRKNVSLSFKALLHKTKDTSSLDLLIKPLLQADEENNNLNLLIFSELLQSESELIINHLTPLLFEGPLTNFKIDIIIANAEALAPQIYQNNLPMIFPELFEEDQQYKDKIIYCINQLSINLGQDDVQSFFIEIQENLEEQIDKNVLEILLYFLKNTSVDFQDYFIEIFQILISKTTMIDKQICEILNEILTIVLNIQDNSGQYLKILISCIQELDTDIYAMNIENGIVPYLQILESSLVEGKEEVFENGLELLNLIINNIDEIYLEPYINRIMGILVRILNYRIDPYIKKKIIDIIEFFQDQPKANLYLQQITYTLINQLNLKLHNVYKDFVKFIINLVGQTQNYDQIMSFVMHRLQISMNENYLYCVYELLKVKASWFTKNHKQIIQTLSEVQQKEITANCRILIGKIFGLLLKQNYHIIDIIQDLENQIEGTEVDIQNRTYFYLLTSICMIRKSQDMLPIKNHNFNLIEQVKKISNQQRLNKIAEIFKKIIDRPELEFLSISKDDVKNYCKQKDEEQDIDQ